MGLGETIPFFREVRGANAGIVLAKESPGRTARARSSAIREKSVKTVFFLTAFFAVVVVAFILLFLLRDGLPIFESVGLPDFLFGSRWA
ncbi:MAG TPA: hypothetical protein VEI51_03860, partial [Methanomicrobiales archaeon]|nr:hypothetical protein [Methanomicrobiales archaeon]